MTPDPPGRDAAPRASVRKYSLSIAGHRTSVSLEPDFWERLNAVARGRAISLPRLIAEIDAAREPGSNLASAIRVFLLRGALASD